MIQNKLDNVVKLASSAEVELFANAAGISKQGRPAQVVTFSEILNSSEIKLIELPSTLLASLEKGERVAFRGQPDDNLVLCTQNSCYELQQADTSNLLLLSPDLVIDDSGTVPSHGSELLHSEIIGSFNETFELKDFRPRYERVCSLLSEHPYIGTELENEPMETPSDCLYCFNDLLKECQCSDLQLKAHLREIQALEIDGYWRILEGSFRDSVLLQILNLIEEKDWDWAAFPRVECVNILTPLFPKFVLEYIVSVFCREVDETCASLDENLICKFHAECLLRPVQRFSYSEFMEIWQQSVPIGMSTKLSHLLDISICDMHSSPPSIWFFPEKSLNSQPYDRLVQLFREKEKWTEDEIRPFLTPLETSKISVNSILLRYTRASTDSTKTKYFSLKKTY